MTKSVRFFVLYEFKIAHKASLWAQFQGFHVCCVWSNVNNVIKGITF